MNNPAKFWNIIKQINTCKRNNTSSDNDVALSAWMEYFKGLLNQKPNVNPQFCKNVNEYLEIHDDECDVCQNKKCDLLDDYVTNSEVCNCILDMSGGKAAGIDGVLVEMLKSSKHVLVRYICALFNNILKTGVYPSRWTESVLCPIYKKGCPTDPSNYRGI